jgi:hypothetical protein
MDVCQNCPNELPERRPGQRRKYCSIACRQAAFRKRVQRMRSATGEHECPYCLERLHVGVTDKDGHILKNVITLVGGSRPLTAGDVAKRFGR